MILGCIECGIAFRARRRRRAARCAGCRTKRRAASQRRYFAANRDELAERQRRYRAVHRGEIKLRRLARLEASRTGRTASEILTAWGESP